jgi:hypothetical protein
LACFGEAYALVELIDVATQNLALLALEIQRQDPRPSVAAGLSMAGSQIDQRQALDVAERLVDCTQSAAGRATADAAAAYAAVAVSEEVDVAIMMAEGFTSDYQMVAARLSQFFDGATDATAKNDPDPAVCSLRRRAAHGLLASKSSLATVIERSTPKPETSESRNLRNS